MRLIVPVLGLAAAFGAPRTGALQPRAKNPTHMTRRVEPNTDRQACGRCHGDIPHTDGALNQRTYMVACQTCHLPTNARLRVRQVAPRRPV